MIRRMVFGMTAMAVVAMAHGLAMAQNGSGKDIVTTAVEAGSFKTLAAALKAAGLLETLQDKVAGPSGSASESVILGSDAASP